MNLLRGRAREGTVTAGDFSFRRAGIADRDVIVGVRPESLRPAVDGLPALDFHVAVVEPLGDEVIVHGSVTADLANATPEEGEAALVAASGDRAAAVARLDPRDRPAEGSVMRLGVDPTTVHLFAGDTGKAIR
jgi:multiple sugar transport system ATP-binding protein